MTINPSDYARLEADTAGVEEEMDRFRREVDGGWHPAVARRWLASVLAAAPLPAFVRTRLAERLGGGVHRTSATTRRKYERIAGNNVPLAEDPKLQRRILAIVEQQVCLVKWSALKEWQRVYVAGLLGAVCPGGSLLELGAGDLATLVGLTQALDSRPPRLGAVDLSERRLALGRRWAAQQRVTVDVMCAANGSSLPFPDGQWDVVLTWCCLEQNSEPLSIILRELHRVAARYVVLVEPSYELGGPLYRRHVLKAGHVRGIPAAARQLGLDVVRHELLPVRACNSEVALTVISKR